VKTPNAFHLMSTKIQFRCENQSEIRQAIFSEFNEAISLYGLAKIVKISRGDVLASALALVLAL